MFRCVTVRSRLALLVGNDLAAAERVLVEKHLLVCAACRAHLSELQCARSALLRCPPLDESRSLWPALRSRLQSGARERRVALRATGWIRWSGVAAASAAIALGLYGGFPGGLTGPEPVRRWHIRQTRAEGLPGEATWVGFEPDASRNEPDRHTERDARLRFERDRIHRPTLSGNWIDL